mgnify:CR=1 FL=1
MVERQRVKFWAGFFLSNQHGVYSYKNWILGLKYFIACVNFLAFCFNWENAIQRIMHSIKYSGAVSFIG